MLLSPATCAKAVGATLLVLSGIFYFYPKVFFFIILGASILFALAVSWRRRHLDIYIRDKVIGLATDAFQVPVTVDRVMCDLRKGTVDMFGITVANPVGFPSAHFVKITSALVELDFMTVLFNDVISVKSIIVNSPDVVYEYTFDKGSNLDALFAKIGSAKTASKSSAPASGASTSGTSSPGPAPTSTVHEVNVRPATSSANNSGAPASGKQVVHTTSEPYEEEGVVKIIVSSLTVTDGSLHLAAEAGRRAEMTVALVATELCDIGKDEGGLAPVAVAELVARTFIENQTGVRIGSVESYLTSVLTPALFGVNQLGVQLVEPANTVRNRYLRQTGGDVDRAIEAAVGDSQGWSARAVQLVLSSIPGLGVPAQFLGPLWRQLRIGALIAALNGHDLTEEKTKIALLWCLTQGDLGSVPKKAVEEVASIVVRRLAARSAGMLGQTAVSSAVPFAAVYDCLTDDDTAFIEYAKKTFRKNRTEVIAFHEDEPMTSPSITFDADALREGAYQIGAHAASSLAALGEWIRSPSPNTQAAIESGVAQDFPVVTAQPQVDGLTVDDDLYEESMGEAAAEKEAGSEGFEGARHSGSTGGGLVADPSQVAGKTRAVEEGGSSVVGTAEGGEKETYEETTGTVGEKAGKIGEVTEQGGTPLPQKEKATKEEKKEQGKAVQTKEEQKKEEAKEQKAGGVGGGTEHGKQEEKGKGGQKEEEEEEVHPAMVAAARHILKAFASRVEAGEELADDEKESFRHATELVAKADAKVARQAASASTATAGRKAPPPINVPEGDGPATPERDEHAGDGGAFFRSPNVEALKPIALQYGTKVAETTGHVLSGLGDWWQRAVENAKTDAARAELAERTAASKRQQQLRQQQQQQQRQQPQQQQRQQQQTVKAPVSTSTSSTATTTSTVPTQATYGDTPGNAGTSMASEAPVPAKTPPPAGTSTRGAGAPRRRPPPPASSAPSTPASAAPTTDVTRPANTDAGADGGPSEALRPATTADPLPDQKGDGAVPAGPAPLVHEDVD